MNFKGHQVILYLHISWGLQYHYTTPIFEKIFQLTMLLLGLLKWGSG